MAFSKLSPGIRLTSSWGGAQVWWAPSDPRFSWVVIVADSYCDAKGLVSGAVCPNAVTFKYTEKLLKYIKCWQEKFSFWKTNLLRLKIKSNFEFLCHAHLESFLIFNKLLVYYTSINLSPREYFHKYCGQIMCDTYVLCMCVRANKLEKRKRIFCHFLLISFVCTGIK